MKNRIISSTKTAILAVSLVIGLSYLSAFGPPVSSTPPVCPSGNTGCDVPINAGTQTQTKNGQLQLTDNFTSLGSGIFGGFVSAGGYGGSFGTSASCSSGYKGNLRFNTSSNSYEYCDGSSWKAMGGSSGSPSTCSSGQVLTYTSSGYSCVSTISNSNSAASLPSYSNVPSATHVGWCQADPGGSGGSFSGPSAIEPGYIGGDGYCHCRAGYLFADQYSAYGYSMGACIKQ